MHFSPELGKTMNIINEFYKSVKILMPLILINSDGCMIIIAYSHVNHYRNLGTNKAVLNLISINSITLIRCHLSLVH